MDWVRWCGLNNFVDWVRWCGLNDFVDWVRWCVCELDEVMWIGSGGVDVDWVRWC